MSEYFDDPATFFEGGAHHAAGVFMDAIVAKDFDTIWSMWAPNAKVFAARHYVSDGRDSIRTRVSPNLDEVVDHIVELGDAGPDRADRDVHRLWTTFTRHQLFTLGCWWSHWNGWPAEYQRREIGRGSRTRLIAPALEKVMFTRCEPEGTEVTPAMDGNPTMELLLEHTGERWLVTGYGDEPIDMAWPPED